MGKDLTNREREYYTDMKEFKKPPVEVSKPPKGEGVLGERAVAIIVRDLDKPGAMTPAEAAANEEALNDALKGGGWGTRIGYVPNGERHNTWGSTYKVTTIQYDGASDDRG